MIDNKKGLLALSPVLVLLGTYLTMSIIAKDFYSISIIIPFMFAIVYGMFLLKGCSWKERLEKFSQGLLGNGVLYMICIFFLAGIFATSAKNMGAVDATVAFTLKIVPPEFVPVGLFVASCFISMAIGTSVGTIAALAPVVVGISSLIPDSLAWLLAIVVGGAFFGDNLSFISDTTIAATQTQGCKMNEKFKTNLLLVLPMAVITILIYVFYNKITVQIPVSEQIEWVKIIPYLLVIVLAITGMDVLKVLFLGIVATDVVGMACGSFTLTDVFTSASNGLGSMYELVTVTMAAAGLMSIIKELGGFDYLIGIMSSGLSSVRRAEFSIVLLTILTNICTANNTIAILTTGPIAKDISGKCGIAARRTASLMDTASCFIQGVLPYGAQLLMAAGLASISPMEIIPHLYYPLLIGLMVVLSILFGKKKRMAK